MEAIILPAGSFVAAFLLALGVLWPKRSAKNQLQPYVAPQVTSTANAPFWKRFFHVASRPVVQLVERTAPTELQEGLRARIEMAGNPMSSAVFLTWQVAGAVLLPLAYALLIFAAGGSFEGRELLMAIFLGSLGGYVPRYWLTSRVDKRQRAIERALPDALDLVIVSMEAGLAFDGALAKVVEKTRGPLPEELQKTLHELVLGTPRRQALRRLATRTGVTDLITLMNAVVQADEMGVSMADVMRVQAEDARIKRRQRAEEEAHKAPIKMLFPLILFILPSVLFVVIGPAALTIYHQFTSGVLAR